MTTRPTGRLAYRTSREIGTPWTASDPNHVRAADLSSRPPLQLVHTASAAAQRARLVAEMAHATYQQTLPPAQRSSATRHMIPPVASGRPVHPLTKGVATLGVANWWVAQAIELAIAAGDAHLEKLVKAAGEMARAAKRAVIAVHHPSSFDDRQALTHAAVSACYHAAGALTLGDPEAELQANDALFDVQRQRMPRSWRALADALAQHLASASDIDGPAHAAAAAAHDAVVQLTRTYENRPHHDGSETAMCASARAAALACTYAGWSVVLMEQEPVATVPRHAAE